MTFGDEFGARDAHARLDTPGLLAAYNPLDVEVTRTMRVDLYDTGVRGVAEIAIEDAERVRHTLSDDHAVQIELKIPARGMSWAVGAAGVLRPRTAHAVPNARERSLAGARSSIPVDWRARSGALFLRA